MATGTVNAAGQAPGRALTGGSAGIGKVWSAQNSTSAALAKGTVSSSGWNNVMSGNLTQNNGTNISAKSMDPLLTHPQQQQHKAIIWTEYNHLSSYCTR